MRYITGLFILFLGFASSGQTTCNVCPSGTSVQLTSTFPSTATHQWTCDNGFSSSIQNPTFAPNITTLCQLVVTDAAGCTASSTTNVNVCNCDCNDPCITTQYNSTTDCVSFADVGTNCSPVSSQIRQWKNQNTAFVNINASNEICNCDIKEYVNTTAAVSVVSDNFRLQINGLQNRCPGCTGSNMSIIFTFPNTGFTQTFFPGCAGTTDWYTISAANFTNAGSVANAYVRYTTPFGVVVNHHRFTYNGQGLNSANVNATTVFRKTIYKDITARRTVSYTDGCPDKTCETVLDIPQQPNDPCVHFFGYINTVNLSAPCSGSGLAGVTLNAVGTVSYQWTLNGSNLAGETSQFLCLVGQPFGTYCVKMSDASGCNYEACIVYQAPCNLTTAITSSGNTLNSTVTGCIGTRTNIWQRWNGSSWVNVGTGTSYNTGGVGGEYRITVTCQGPPICTSIANFLFIPPCVSAVTITTGSSTLTANVTGCSGALISYTWQRWNGSSWVTVQTASTTSTNHTHTPSQSGLYRIQIVCNSCPAEAQANFTMPNPCIGFSVLTSGPSSICNGSSGFYTRTISGGTSPYSHQWRVNGGVVLGTGTSFTYTPPTTGTYVVQLTITDANNCVVSSSTTTSVVNCCGMSAAITPTTQSICQNQNATFTASQTGGTTPISYSWTSQLSPNGPINQGTGISKTFNFSTAGTYNIQVTATDATGCAASASGTLTVTNCTDCACTPNLTLNGCVLTGSMSGAGCTSFSYQLQYSLTGTGWTPLNTGPASNGFSFTHTPTANGVYRLVLFSSTGCQGIETPLVSVNCFQQTCSNPPLVELNGSSYTGCGTSTITIGGNTFGGSATLVTLTENGGGSIFPTSVTTSPFFINYTPTVADYGNTVTITATTNNPLGEPCTPQVRTLGINVNPIPSPTITSSSDALCVGSSRTITTNISGGTLSVSGPATLSGNTITATGVGTITLTYSVTSLGCTGTTTQNITVINCPCDGLSMSITPVSGGLSFGTLNFNGVPQTNYSIEWRKCSDNSVVFTSGMGSGGGSGIFPHPSSNIPLVGDCYYAFIVFSPQGNNLNCFSQFTVQNWTCTNPPTYTYNGPGGAVSTREFRMNIASSTNIRVGQFATAVVPDNLEIIYNGVVLYSGSRSFSTTQTPVIVPISFVSGVTFVAFRVTNSDPSLNTIWTLNNVSCCSPVTCPSKSDVPVITSVTATLNTSCGCSFNIQYSSYNPNCSGCGFPIGINSTRIGSCGFTNFFSRVCVNETVVITKNTGASKSFDFSSSANYNQFKNDLQSATIGQRISYRFSSLACGNDGASLSTYNLLPFNHNITYDDVNFIVTITIPPTNPFSNSCTNCDKIKHDLYNDILGIFNSTISTGTFQGIPLRSGANAISQGHTSLPVNSAITCNEGNCGGNLIRPYRITFRDSNCRCQSWELYEDTNNNGIYDTLILQATGWNGTCQQ